MIELPEGYGEVGRSLYQRLRECKTLHELAWGDEMYHDDKTGRLLTRSERGRKLKDQKPYIVADIAAVLGGIGKSNKIRPLYVMSSDSEGEDVAAPNPPKIPELTEPMPEMPPDEPAEESNDDAETSAAEEQDGEGAEGDEGAEKPSKVAIAMAGTKGRTAREEDVVDGLIRATVHWVNELDRNFARRWTANVTHVPLRGGEWPAPLKSAVALALSDKEKQQAPTAPASETSKGEQEPPKQESSPEQPPKQESPPQAP